MPTETSRGPVDSPASPAREPAAKSAVALRDVTAGVVVFLVAVPLCLGIALASGAPLFSGVLAGIIGGVVVGALSGSHTSVSGPAAGLTAVVAAQIAALGSFEGFLFALLLAGVIQVGLGIARAGFVASFVPSSVIKGLLAAIGSILILKQLPHLLGYDLDPEGDLAFARPGDGNTLSEVVRALGAIHPGATAVGVLSLAVLIAWSAVSPLKRSPVPAPLVVVVLGVGAAHLLGQLGGAWVIEPTHLVQVPVASSAAELVGFLQLPDLSQWANPALYVSALTIAIVASLETLLNLEAVDRLDPRQRTSPPSRELIAQGVGNMICGLVGALPVTSVVVRSSVNVDAGAESKLSTILHGILLVVSVAFLPTWLNAIPLSCLAAILLVTGGKLVTPAVVKEMWRAGRPQFVPFAVTVVAIVFTDLLLGIVVGLAVSVFFILRSNLRRPLERIVEKHLGREVTHIRLANQVSFLNRAALSNVLDEVRPGAHVLLDAESTDYVDPDVLALIRDFRERTAPARGVAVSTLGFAAKYPELHDRTLFVDYSTRELQAGLTPQQVWQILMDGHERVREGRRLHRDLGRQRLATATDQHPIAVVLSCVDSRSPAELVFDAGVGDILNVRVAGNVTSRKILGSIEYGCVVTGAKLALVMGHTRCGAVAAAVTRACSGEPAARATGCEHLDHITDEIWASVGTAGCHVLDGWPASERDFVNDRVARLNVLRVVERIREESGTLGQLERDGRIVIAGAVYDVVTGRIELLTDPTPLTPRSDEAAAR